MELVDAVLDMLDGVGPRSRFRKCVGGVMRAQRRPSDQRHKQAQRADDRRGVFSPPSLRATAPIHRADIIQNRPVLQYSVDCEMPASLLRRDCWLTPRSLICRKMRPAKSAHFLALFPHVNCLVSCLAPHVSNPWCQSRGVRRIAQRWLQLARGGPGAGGAEFVKPAVRDTSLTSVDGMLPERGSLNGKEAR